MRTSSKVAAIIVAFSLGLTCVWATGSFSYLFDQSALAVPELALEISETPPHDPAEVQHIFAAEKRPRFDDYAVANFYKGKIATPQIPEKDLLYGPRLQLAVENQVVNFAGHYIATNWSCGMWCSTNAIIDARNGEVHWPPVSAEVCLPHLENEFVCDEKFTNFEYRIDSKLVALFGFRFDNNPDGEKGFHYYKFENGRFIHLKSILVKEQRTARQIQIDEFDYKSE